MSANTDPTNGCAGKQRFETFGAASRIARKASARRQKAFKPYHCRHCAGFHYGSTTYATRKRPRGKEERYVSPDMAAVERELAARLRALENT